MRKLTEHTQGNHIYMRIELPHGVEEIDVYVGPHGNLRYTTSADHMADFSTRFDIINAFQSLY